MRLALIKRLEIVAARLNVRLRDAGRDERPLHRLRLPRVLLLRRLRVRRLRDNADRDRRAVGRSLRPARAVDHEDGRLGSLSCRRLSRMRRAQEESCGECK